MFVEYTDLDESEDPEDGRGPSNMLATSFAVFQTLGS